MAQSCWKKTVELSPWNATHTQLITGISVTHFEGVDCKNLVAKTMKFFKTIVTFENEKGVRPM